MIKINLLPPEFRVKTQSAETAQKKMWFLGGAALFLLITVYFYIHFLFLAAKLNAANSEWRVMEPQFREMSALRAEVEGQLQHEKTFMNSFATTERPLTPILVSVNRHIPNTGWLEQLQLKREGENAALLIKGVCFNSPDKTSIEHIENYLNLLKRDFGKTDLTLTTTRKIIEGVEVTQFTAFFSWGAKKAK